MIKDAGTTAIDDIDADTDATPMSDENTEEKRKLAMDLARAIFVAMQKIDGEGSVDRKSDAFKDEWAAERPRMMKIARSALRKLKSNGYEITATETAV